MLRGRTVVRSLLIAIGAVVALSIAAVAAIVLFVDFDAVIAKHQARAIASASAAIGRPVKVASIETSWWPVGIEAKNVEIEGLGHAEALQLEVSLWDIVKSQGKEVLVDSIVLVHPIVELSRDENGRMSIADILEHMKNRPKREMDPKTAEMLKRAQIDSIEILDGTVTFTDRAAPGGIGLFFVDDVDVQITGVALGRPAAFEVRMGILARSQNFELAGTTAPLSADPAAIAIPEIARANLRAEGVPLRGMRLWLPKDGPVTVMDSELFADVELTEKRELMADATVTKVVLSEQKPQVARAKIEGSGSSNALDIRTGRLSFGDGIVKLEGRIDRNDIDLIFDSDPIDLARLGLVRKGPASLQARGRITGPVSEPSEQAAKIDVFRFVAGDTVISGSGLIDGLTEPRIKLDATSPNLDVDALEAMFEGPKDGSPRGKLSITADATLAAKMGKISGVAMRDLKMRASLRNGQLSLRSASADAYGGRLVADGTTIDLDAEPLDYQLEVEFITVDADGLFTNASSLGRILHGTLDASIDLTGHGVSWPEIASSITGEIGGRIKSGKFEGVDILRSVTEPLAAALPFVDRAAGIELERATTFSELGGTFHVEKGIMRLLRPLKVDTDAGTIFFTGAIGLDKKLDLEGRFDLSPDTIAELTRGRLKPPGAIPVSLGLGCTLLSPCVTNVDVEDAVKTLVAMEAKRMLPSVEEQARKKLHDILGL